jgi:glyoxylase-like metal-dependent hydrolase (beta-lactamase superfamily II)
MSVQYRIISIGAMSRNHLWGEQGAVRPPHATMTLVTEGDRHILVDPSLPDQVLAGRFSERTGARLDMVTDIFCTTLRPVHRFGIEAFPHANWWTSEAELDAFLPALEEAQGSADRLDADAEDIEAELRVVRRFKPAPDKFGEQIHLYPLAGPSPGSAGLLLTPTTRSILIAGDAAITRDHLEAGQVWQGCVDIEQAMDSFADILEVADIVICGHDNLEVLSRRLM